MISPLSLSLSCAVHFVFCFTFFFFFSHYFLIIVVVLTYYINKMTKHKLPTFAGKALTIDAASSEPWYVYAGGMAAVLVLLKIAGDVASGVIESLDDGDEHGKVDGSG